MEALHLVYLVFDLTICKKMDGWGTVPSGGRGETGCPLRDDNREEAKLSPWRNLRTLRPEDLCPWLAYMEQAEDSSSSLCFPLLLPSASSYNMIFSITA